jgi:hypothetical protein
MSEDGSLVTHIAIHPKSLGATIEAVAESVSGIL